jgi:hypothetical protein
MRYWLSEYMFEQAATHCVCYAYPEKEKQSTGAKKSREATHVQKAKRT